MNWTSKTNLARLKLSCLHDKIDLGLVTYGTWNRNYHYYALHMEKSDILSDFIASCSSCRLEHLQKCRFTLYGALTVNC